MNPWRTVVCPHCHEKIHPGECRVVSTVAYKNLPPGTPIHEATTGFFSRAFVTPLSGPEYTRYGAVRVCPRCDRTLPSNIERVKSYTIAIVGDSTSGKSHYIASCIHQLQQNQGYKLIGYNAIVGLGNTDLTYNNEYYALVYQNKKKVQPTQAGIQPEPLIYELVFPGKSVNLLFYDASGEDMVNAGQMVQYGHYILNASAIIFLADPMAMPGVVPFVPDHIKQLQPPRTLGAAQALNRIIYTFKQGRGLNQGDMVDIPIAITISKSDLLDFVEQTSNLPLFLKDATDSNRLDTGQFGVISQQVQDRLFRYGDSVLIRASKMFTRSSFFAVSATGKSSDSNDEFQVIEPRRCLDPLLWVLWQLGIINDE